MCYFLNTGIQLNSVYIMKKQFIENYLPEQVNKNINIS